MFLEADLVAKSEKNAIQIARKLLIDGNSVFTVEKDSILSLSKVVIL